MIYLVIILVLLGFSYISLCLYIGRNVSAGDVDTVNFTFHRLPFISPYALLSYPGPNIPFNEICLAKADGDSCNQCNIKKGDLVLGQNFKSKKDINIEPHDVLFIKFHHEKTNRDEFKIREFINFIGDTKVQTRKNDNGELVPSRQHDISKLVGKACFVYRDRTWISIGSSCS